MKAIGEALLWVVGALLVLSMTGLLDLFMYMHDVGVGKALGQIAEELGKALVGFGILLGVGWLFGAFK